MAKIQASTKVIIRDDKWQAVMSALTADPSLELEAGLLDEDSAIAEYGFYNEFGTATIPARSFIRSTFDQNQRKYITMIDEALNAAMLKADPLRSAMTKLGIRQRNDIIKKITRLRTPINEDSTIERKGSSNPLIDDGIMRLAIRYRIVTL